MPVLIAAMVLLFDPIGLYSTTNRVSRDLAFRALSLGQSGPEDRFVAIVLLDDPSADRLNGEYGYPITFEHQAEVLRAVLCRGPASVFIDFSFRNIRTRDVSARVMYGGDQVSADLAAFLNAFATRPAADSPYCAPLAATDGVAAVLEPRTFLARTRSVSRDGCDPLFEAQIEGGRLPDRCKAGRQLSHLGRVTTPLSMARLEAEGTYAVVVRPSLTFADPPNGIDQSLPTEPSPALASLLALCSSLEAARAQAFRGCRDREALEQFLKEGDAPLLVPIWPYFRTGAVRQGPIAPGCRPSQDDHAADRWTKLAMIVSELLRTLVRGQLGDPNSYFGKALCLPYETRTVAGYTDLASNCAGRDPTACARAQSDVVAGRMVFYGASVVAVHDEVDSPVLGVVPGVAMHAVAAANLLRFGIDYVREPPTWSVGLFRIGANQIIELCLLVSWFVIWLFAPRSWRSDQYLLRFGLAGLWALSFTAIAYWALAISPANWLGLWLALHGTVPKDASS